MAIVTSKLLKNLLKFRNSKKSVLFFVIAGAVFTLFRELIVIFSLGDSLEADLFRLSFTLPNFFIQSVGGLYVSILVGLIIRNKNNLNEVFYKNTLIVFFIFLLLFFTTEFQLNFFYSGMSNYYDEVKVWMQLSWLPLLIAGFIFFPRAKLNSIDDRFSSSSANFFRSSTFVAVYFILSLNYSSYHSLLIASILSVIPWLYTHRRGFKNISFFSEKKIEKESSETITFSVGAISGLAFAVINSSLYFLDKWFASFLSEGSFSIVGYAYGFIHTPVAIAVSVLLIILLPSFVKNNKFSILSKFKLLIFLTAISSLAIFSLFDFAEIFLVKKIMYYFNFSLHNAEGFVLLAKFFSSCIFLVIISLFISHYLLATGRYLFAIFAAILKVTFKVIYLFSSNNVGFSEIAESYIISEIIFFILVTITFFATLKKTDK